ncbi:MAG: EAL domain-containing protein [Pseudomonadota bacterium]|nr:EAL domain-containing protein [Pseudomonadota bacterium]
MRKKPANANNIGTIYTNLPVKITGIVFWGLVLLGLVASAAFISFLESQLTAERELKLDLTHDSVKYIFSTPQPASPLNYSSALETLRQRFGFSAMEVRLNNEVIQAGEYQADLDVSETTFPVYTSSKDGINFQQQARVKIYLSPLKDEITRYRKNILVIMAAIFLGFGLILQAILKHVLSRPIINMVQTADSIVRGNSSIRFDEKREDEFGFLGSFINRVLDHLTTKQEELENSLSGQQIAEQFLSREKERVEITLYSISDAVITTTRSGHIDFINRAAEELSGLNATSLHGREISAALKLHFDDGKTPMQLPVNAAVHTNTDIKHVPLRGTCVVIRNNGNKLNVRYNVAPILDRKGVVMGSVIVLHDITDTLALTEKLSHQATHDSLTGLFNRAEFDHRIHLLLKQLQNSKIHTKHALLYMDLDQFKIVNDSCGHMAGDQLLRHISERLQQRLSDSGTLARLGGDEFGVLIENCNRISAHKVADELRKEVENFRFQWQEKTFSLGISIGVVMIDKNSESPDLLLSMADRACYAAKDTGRNKICMYQPNDIEMVRRKRDTQWVSRLRKALETNSLLLSQQAIVAVGSKQKHGSMFEILVGLENNEGERIPAGAFLAAAERFGLMPQMDRWIINNIFLWLSRNPEQLHQLDRCMINLSGQTLNDETIASYIMKCMEKSSIPAEKICFEITETSAISNLAKTSRLIRNLKTEGCHFALDDFGSGMSSYAYLKHLPVDYIKIDGIFVRDLAEDPIDLALVHSINEIAHILDKKTIAEYVENDDILKKLQEIGVDYAQGFGIAYPEAIKEEIPPDGSQASQ